MLEPTLVFDVTFYLGLFLALIGIVKMVIYLTGEFLPQTWGFIKSEGIRKAMTGLANRLIFGLGGLLTALLGAGFMWLAKYLEQLDALG